MSSSSSHSERLYQLKGKKFNLGTAVLTLIITYQNKAIVTFRKYSSTFFLFKVLIFQEIILENEIFIPIVCAQG